MARSWPVVLAVRSALATSSWWSYAHQNGQRDELLSERAVDDCPSSHTTSTGLDFKTYCDTDQIGWDLIPETGGTVITSPATSMVDCMDQCASQRPLCYGIAFKFLEQKCFFKNNTFTYKSSAAIKSNVTHLAVARRSELQPLDTDCQYRNGTQQQQNGLNFTIHCNQDIVGADYCAWSALDCKYHADSLQDCMDHCTRAQPQCQAVAFNPDMMHGYGNCYPKFNLTQGYVRTGGSIGDGAVTHSAVARLPDIPFNCTENAVIASDDGKGFTLSCNQDRPGSDITQFHADNITTCVTNCSQWNGGGTCIAVIFDTNMTNGFQNCYLKGAVGTPVTADKEGFILALQGGAVSSSTPSSSSAGPTNTGAGGAQQEGTTSPSPSSSPSSSGGGLSGGAIAGIVIGVIAALALVGAVVFLLLRRRATPYSEVAAPPYTGPPPVAQPSQTQSQTQTPSQSTFGYGQIDHKFEVAGQNQAAPPPDAVWQGGQQPYSDGRTFEMEDQARVELPVAKAERIELPAPVPGPGNK